MKEFNLPSHRVIYNRSGNLATTTKLDQERADNFMSVSDMRRDILIVDTDILPERDTVAVSSDTLAFRAIEPFRRLTEMHFNPKPFHSLIRQADHLVIQIYERQIDDAIRSGHHIDSTDYNEQFLGFLNKAVKDGLSETLFQEKLSFREHRIGYGAYAGWFSINIIGEGLPLIASIIGLVVVLHPMVNTVYHSSGGIHSRSWKEILLPPVPIDRWARGQFFLASHGETLVIPVNERC